MVSRILWTRVIESRASRTPEEREMRADLKSVVGCWNSPGELERVVSMLLLATACLSGSYGGVYCCQCVNRSVIAC